MGVERGYGVCGIWVGCREHALVEVEHSDGPGARQTGAAARSAAYPEWLVEEEESELG
jgi:hypothetical protein